MVARGYRAAARGVEAALAKDPAQTTLRDLLGDILLERARLAVVMHDRDAADELLDRLASYDADGSRRAWSKPARHADRPGAGRARRSRSMAGRSAPATPSARCRRGCTSPP